MLDVSNVPIEYAGLNDSLIFLLLPTALQMVQYSQCKVKILPLHGTHWIQKLPENAQILLILETVVKTFQTLILPCQLDYYKLIN